MSRFTDYEQILRLAISGGLWTFMSEEHHDHVRDALVPDPNFWIDYVDVNDPVQTMEMIVKRAERMGLEEYYISDDRTSFLMMDEEEKGIIHQVLIEIPDDEEDDEDFDEDFDE